MKPPAPTRLETSPMPDPPEQPELAEQRTTFGGDGPARTAYHGQARASNEDREEDREPARMQEACELRTEESPDKCAGRHRLDDVPAYRAALPMRAHAGHRPEENRRQRSRDCHVKNVLLWKPLRGNSIVRKGTSSMPPPIPSSPARNPVAEPRTSSIAMKSGDKSASARPIGDQRASLMIAAYSPAVTGVIERRLPR